MKTNESVRKYILIGFVLLIGIGLIAAKSLAGKQDDVFLYDSAVYQQVAQLYEEENYTEALAYVEELLKEQPNSADANYIGAILITANEDYTRAAMLMQKVLDLNPYKAEDEMFMLQFGEILTFAERFDDAKLVLEKCREMGWAPEDFPEYQDYVTQLLAEIESK